MGVDVDPARCDKQAPGVDLAAAAALDLADGGDAVAVDRDVALARGPAASVHEGSPSDHQVVAGVGHRGGLLRLPL